MVNKCTWLRDLVQKEAHTEYRAPEIDGQGRLSMRSISRQACVHILEICCLSVGLQSMSLLQRVRETQTGAQLW